MRNQNWIYHLVTLVVCIIWGTTFISTKVLFGGGLSPAQIMFYRFAIAYAIVWTLSDKRVFARSVKDELWMLCAGFCGGSLYFMTENQALKITLASNVSIIITIAPILTAILFAVFYKDQKLRSRVILGSLTAFAGVALVVFNGSFILQLNPVGDILTVIAALSWALYNIVLKKVTSRYDILFITRKVFFYGLLTLSPIFFFTPFWAGWDVISKPVVWGNLLFLGVIASMLCFWMWNVAVKHIGGVSASSYIYVTPLVTLITANIVLEEPITAMAVGGALMILYGVYLSERKKQNGEKQNKEKTQTNDKYQNNNEFQNNSKPQTNNN